MIIDASEKFFGEKILPGIGFHRHFIILSHHLIIYRMHQLWIITQTSRICSFVCSSAIYCARATSTQVAHGLCVSSRSNKLLSYTQKKIPSLHLLQFILAKLSGMIAWAAQGHGIILLD